ncbi:CD151 antigen-like [Liolophura sinensis]|uniref:CD151 antigen-like n=1 Tax=Liolophura sinensis TaxID=3198878 RepID=UPI00315847A2
MGVDERLRCLKWPVILYNILYFLISCAVLGVAVWLRFDFFASNFLEADEAFNGYYIATYVFMVGGSLGFIGSIIGFVGIGCLKFIPIVIYLVMVIGIFLLELGGGVFVFVYRDEIQHSLARGEVIQRVVKQEYGVVSSKTKAIDFMQWELRCCGGDSYTDYTGSTWYNSDIESRKDRVPLSCCKDYERYKDNPNYRSCAMYKNQQGTGPIREPSQHIHNTACGEAIVQFISDHIVVLGAIGLTLFLMQIFGITMISMLIHYLRKQQAEEGFEMSRSFEKTSWKGGNPYW